MQRIKLIMAVLSFPFLLAAQDSLYVLHTLTGPQIDKATKKKYYLFPEVKDSLFKYAEIHKREGKIILESHFTNDSIASVELTRAQLEKNASNVQKLSEYYSNKEKKDTTGKIDLSTEPDKVNKDLATPGLSEEQKAEIQRDARLKEDQERMKNYQQGTETSPTNIEIYNSGKKKKKK
jgi:hypothetical protein